MKSASIDQGPKNFIDKSSSKQFQISICAASVAKDSNWEIQPSGRISIIGKDRSWRATCMVENSDLVGNALFLQFDLTQEISQKHTFENILDSYRRISYTCMSFLDLQQVNE